MASDYFNYFEDLKTGMSQRWASYMNLTYINTSGVPLLVFRMDKNATPQDNLYGEETHSRYYVGPIEIRGLTLDPLWKQMMGFEQIQTYQEVSDAVSVVVNLDNMVNKIREARDFRLATIDMSYANTGTVVCSNQNGFFVVKRNGTVIANADLSIYKTMNSLYGYLHGISGLVVVKKGENSPTSKLVNFAETNFTGNSIQVYVKETKYDGCSEIFEKGDIILTPNNFLYEVSTNITTGDYGWDYSTYSMMCNRISLENITLPEGYIQKVYRNDGRLAKLNRDGYTRKIK